MKWSAPQLKGLRDTLLQAFPNRDALRMLVFDHLGENLNAIAGNGGLEASTFELVEWAEAQGRVPELVVAAMIERPHSQALREYVKTLPSDWNDSTAQIPPVDGPVNPGPGTGASASSSPTGAPPATGDSSVGSSSAPSIGAPPAPAPAGLHASPTSSMQPAPPVNIATQTSGGATPSSDGSIRPFTRQEWKGFTIATTLIVALIAIFELAVYTLPLTWLVNHQNSFGLQIAADLMLAFLLYGAFLPKRRVFLWSVGGVGLLLVIVQIVGGPGSQVPGPTTPTPTQ